MAGRGHRSFGSGAYRGSRKRLKRISVRHNTSLAFWFYALLVLFMLLVVLAWLIKHPPRDHAESIFGYADMTIAVATA